MNSTIPSPLPPSSRITLAFLMGILAFAIMLGNAIVILAFVVDKNLRHRSNYFFLNLAICDFFVGVISIPLYIPQKLFDEKLENQTCVFWLIVDYLLCTASVYNIVLISYDRYQSVSNAFSYRAQHSGIWKIVVLMVAVWVLAFLVNGPLIIISYSWKEKERYCSPGFFSKWYILAITSFLEFLAPVFLMAYFNIYIYWSLWKRSRPNRGQSPPELSSASSGNSEHLFKCPLFSKTSLAEPKEAAAALRFKRQPRKNSFFLCVRTQKKRDIIASKTDSLSRSDNLILHQKEYIALLKSKKLAKSLAILLGVFIVCWAPYSLFTFVHSIYKSGQQFYTFGAAETIIYEVTFWLQWCNSLINPFLYPLCHKRFQKAFLKVFCLKKQPILPPSQTVSS
ncbi:histamine receptor H4 [Phyllostomus discolor]|uniref:Histamine H4 receptor n=1 Tax=Phyllostomus discolor TaxID=89673 RepID=A0A6J2MMM4_9CHIR|nr:histamine H4 receptor [Phyllostomus discolor]KAF6088113.1 histamine receptor H4 [Phyllostomus discolor]